MNGFLAFIWLVIILGNVFVRAMKRRNESASGSSPVRRTVSDVQMNRQRTVEPQVIRPAQPEPFRQVSQPDVTGKTRKPVKPLQPLMQMHFTGRDDLEPGYMYLNGVKVLIKEADRLEFLK